MAIIIDFKDYKANARKNSGTSIFFSQEELYWRMMEDRKLLLPVFMELAEEAIRDLGFDPDDFAIDPISMQEYMGAWFDAEKPFDEIEGPSFNHITERQIIRVTTSAKVDEDAMIEFTADAYSINDYDQGNRAWLFHNGSAWEEGPGEDFFDLDQILSPLTNDR